jgi:hypothetical protein
MRDIEKPGHTIQHTKKSPPAPHHPKGERKRHFVRRNRRQPRMSVWRIEHILGTLGADTVKEYRAKLRVLIEDDLFWQYIEDLNEAEVSQHRASREASNRMDKLIRGGKRARS